MIRARSLTVVVGSLDWATNSHSSPIVWGDQVCTASAISGTPDPQLKVGLYGDIGSVLDQTGLSQKAGPVVSDVRAPAPEVSRPPLVADEASRLVAASLELALSERFGVNRHTVRSAIVSTTRGSYLALEPEVRKSLVDSVLEATAPMRRMPR